MSSRLRQRLDVAAWRGRRMWLRGLRALERGTAPLRRRAPPVGTEALFVGYAEGDLGLGQSFRGLCAAARSAGVPFRILPLSAGIENRRSGPFMRDLHAKGRTSFAVNVIEVAAHELETVFLHVGSDRFDRSHNVLRTYWELARAPAEWRPLLADIHEIWAPNRFVADAFRPIFEGPIVVVPPFVDVGATVAAARQEGAPFRFLFSFDPNSYTTRKNPLGVVRAFARAFPTGREGAELWIKSSPSPRPDGALREAAASDPRIVLIEEAFDRERMLGLIAGCDAYVSLHRSEGFGLGMAEAMALGKTVIGTDYSGSTDFLSDRTGFPVACRLRPVEPGEYAHAAGQEWAEPDEADCADAMRRAVADPVEGARRGDAARRLMRERYGRAAVGETVKARLGEILAARREGSAPPRA